MSEQLTSDDKKRLSELKYCKILANRALKNNPDDKEVIELLASINKEIKKLTK